MSKNPYEAPKSPPPLSAKGRRRAIGTILLGFGCVSFVVGLLLNYAVPWAYPDVALPYERFHFVPLALACITGFIGALLRDEGPPKKKHDRGSRL